MTSIWVLIAKINLRHATTRKLRSGLTISGIATGVALVFSISVINTTLLASFRASIRELAGAAELEVAAADASGLPEDVVSLVRATSGVEQAVPVLRSITTAVSPEAAERVQVLGVTASIVSLFPGPSSPFADLDLIGGFGSRGAGLVLSSSLADTLRVGPGDDVLLEAAGRKRVVNVTGRVRGGAISLLEGGNVAVMLLPAAQELFGKTGRVDSVYVEVEPSASPERVDEVLTERLGGAGMVGPPGERGAGLERVFAGLGALLSLAGTVALFVALFVVYNTMSMALAERRREISISLAMGATRRQVAASFLGEAFVLGVLSSLAGVALGLVMARFLVERALESYRVLPITGGGPIVVTGGAIAVAVLGGTAVAMLGALVPAGRVLRVAPVDALRPVAAYEWDHGGHLGMGTRIGVVLGSVSLVLAAAMLGYFTVRPDERWVATSGLVLGLAGVTFLLPQIVPFAIRIVKPALGRAFGTVGRLSMDSLEKNPGRTTFTVAALVLTLGMALGVGSALSSYHSQIKRTAEALVGAPFYVVAGSFTGIGSDQPLPASFEDDLEATPGVAAVYPIRLLMVSLGAEQGLLYAVPIGEAIRAGATTNLDEIASDRRAFIQGLERGEVAVSRLTADRLDLEVGERLELPTPAGGRSFDVAAVFDDLISFDSLYIDYETYVRVWDDARVDEFGVLLDADVAPNDARRALDATVRRARLDADVFSKNELIARILDVVEGTFSLGRGIQLAALVVAILTIVNTMFTAVLERRREMSLQRALGMSKRELRRGVLLEAAGIGLVGSMGAAILGTASGWLMTQTMEAQFEWRILFEPPYVASVFALLGGTMIAAAAGIAPSTAAVRSRIIEALRYE